MSLFTIFMDVQEKINELEKENLFSSWKKKNSGSYLAHVFRMMDEPKIWQFGFYNKDDTITTFVYNDGEVKETPEEEIFKKTKEKIPALDVESVKLSFEDAVSRAEELHKEKYFRHPVMKTIAILQKIEDDQIFNLTFVTKTFNTLNIRVDSSDGRILHEKLTSIMDMAEFEKGEKGNKDTSYIG